MYSIFNAIYIGAVAGLFYTGNIRCGSNPDGSNLDCPIVPIVNLSKNQETSMSVAVMTLALFGLVFLTCCHIFLIALQKLRVRFILYGFIGYSHNFANILRPLASESPKLSNYLYKIYVQLLQCFLNTTLEANDPKSG